jgi:hypothetical protein
LSADSTSASGFVCTAASSVAIPMLIVTGIVTPPTWNTVFSTAPRRRSAQSTALSIGMSRSTMANSSPPMRANRSSTRMLATTTSARRLST